MKEGIIILGHGSRREDANEEIREITNRLKAKNPAGLYKVAFLEFGKPSLIDAIEGLLENGVEKVVVMPMFLTVGNHMHRDIPGKILRLKTTYPNVKFTFAKHLGPDERIVEIVEDRIKDAAELV
ncbi:MAG: sirohydrochlorin chelatase [Peptococcaceae bacterium]